MALSTSGQGGCRHAREAASLPSRLRTSEDELRDQHPCCPVRPRIRQTAQTGRCHPSRRSVSRGEETPTNTALVTGLKETRQRDLQLPPYSLVRGALPSLSFHELFLQILSLFCAQERQQGARLAWLCRLAVDRENSTAEVGLVPP